MPIPANPAKADQRRRAGRPRVARVREYQPPPPVGHFTALGNGGAMPDGHTGYDWALWPARLTGSEFIACLYLLRKSFKAGLFGDVALAELAGLCRFGHTRQARKIIDALVAKGVWIRDGRKWRFALDVAAIEALPLRPLERREEYSRKASHRARTVAAACEVDLPADEESGEPVVGEAGFTPEPEPAAPPEPPLDAETVLIRAEVLLMIGAVAGVGAMIKRES